MHPQPIWSIIVDDRERAIINSLEDVAVEFNGSKSSTKCGAKGEFEIDCKTERLEVGDYAIVYADAVVAIFERKTWRDLAASIKNNRNESQKEKMLALREATGCTVFYIIEGKKYKQTKKFGGIPMKALQAYLDHVMFRHSFHIEYCSDELHLATRLFEIARNISTMKPQHPIISKAMAALTAAASAAATATGTTTAINAEGGSAMLKQHTPPTDIKIKYDMLASIPFVSYKVANMFVDAKIRLIDLMCGKLNADQIAIMRYPSGAIIGKNATKIVSNAIERKTHIAILSAIPLITKDSAAIILEWLDSKGGIEALAEGKIAVDEIQDIKKSESKRLGPKAAANLLHHLVF